MFEAIKNKIKSLGQRPPVKCSGCGKEIDSGVMLDNFYICPECGKYLIRRGKQIRCSSCKYTREAEAEEPAARGEQTGHSKNGEE